MEVTEIEQWKLVKLSIMDNDKDEVSGLLANYTNHRYYQWFLRGKKEKKTYSIEIAKTLLFYGAHHKTLLYYH